MNWRVRGSLIEGSLIVPGDKSIAHRAIMLAALADGVSTIRNVPDGADVSSTAACARLLGARVVKEGGDMRVTGDGCLSEPVRELDAGNSGTSMRLLTGLLAGQPFSSTLNGDESLRRRPMRRVIEPLERMGSKIGSLEGRAPLTIEGAPLHGIHYTLPVASAQVKSAILLAGLFAEGETTVTEPSRSRDHTERMLASAGVYLERKNGTVSVTRGAVAPLALQIPGDFSSAAFFLAAAALGGGELVIREVGINPTRTGFLRVLERMGVQVEIGAERTEGGEPRATLRTRGRADKPVAVNAEEVPLLIDEIPLVVLLATQAHGVSVIRGAAELRVKETDRVAIVGSSLRALGADVEELPDGFVVRGPSRLRGATVASGGDHRIAMMLAVAGAVADGETIVQGAECATVSFPRFEEAFVGVGGSLDVG